jgi:hypothetical protein
MNYYPDEKTLLDEEAVMVADYLHELNAFLEERFGGLKEVEHWEKLYIHLARIVVTQKNDKCKHQKEFRVNPNHVFMPKSQDIFQACRLMYQAIVPLRMGIPDGQHRVAAMMEIMTGWKIVVQTRDIPPRVFKRESTTDEEVLTRALSSASNRVMGRIFVPKSHDIENESERYSKMREESQSKHKPRVLVDV